MDDFFLNVINKPVEEQALAGKKELWAQAPIIQQAKGRNEILKLAKFMSTINNQDVNAEMQEFYKKQLSDSLNILRERIKLN